MNPPAAMQAARATERLEQRISIAADGSVIARSGKVDYGQGIYTGFARIVASELSIEVERVQVLLGDTDQTPWDMGTFGSMSTATDGRALRAAAAFARSLLIARASRQLGAATSSLKLRGGLITAPDGRAVSYQALVAPEGGGPLAGVVPPYESNGPPPQPAAEVAARRLEARDIVLGRPRFCADLQLPGMLRGAVLHGPTPRSRVKSLEERGAASMPGVHAIVRRSEFVGIVADREEQALAAQHTMSVSWTAPTSEAVAPTRIVLQAAEGVASVLSAAAVTATARYHVPHIAHAAVCPSVAVAEVRGDSAHLYVATQRPFALRDEVANLLQMPLSAVHVHPQAMGGMFGRGNANDAALEAVHLSRAVGRPVLLQWSRTDEFHLSPHRPSLDGELTAGLDQDGAICAWHYHSRTNPHTYGAASGDASMLVLTSGRNAIPPYRLGASEILLEVAPGPVRTGALRSLAAAPNVFAIESFIDELAHVSGQDPLAFRLRHIADPRLEQVVRTVSACSQWPQRVRRPGRGFGAACAIYHGTYIAQVVEISMSAERRAQLQRVWCAVDAGEIIWPDGARNQIEGAIQQAASWTLLEQLAHADGQVRAATWHDYPIATILDAPESIEVIFIHSQAPATGIGEPGAVPVAAAIANAIYDAAGIRLRSLPLDKPFS